MHTMANLQVEEELHAVFGTCGVTDHQATRAQMIARKGFINLGASLGKLESDNDITEMAKKVANCTHADV